MLINIPQTIEGSFHAPRTLQYLNNMYNIGGVAIPRENYKAYRSATDLSITDNDDYEGRCMFTSDDGSKLYYVFGDKLYKQTGTGSSTQVGSAMTAGSNGKPFNVAVGFGGAVITTTSSRHYYLDTTNDTLTQITDSDLQTNSKYCVYIDGRYVWPVAEKVYYSDVNDPQNIQSLSFFDAESRPDQNLNAAVIQNDLYIFGTESIERFRPTGNLNTPFVRVQNSVMAVGYVAGMVRLSDRVIFVGRKKGAGLRVYELTNGALREISNDAVNELLALFYKRFGAEWREYSLSSGYDFDDNIIADSFDSYGRTVFTFTFGVEYDRTVTSLGGGGLTVAGIFDQGGYKWSFLSDSWDESDSFENRILTYGPETDLNVSTRGDNRFSYRFHTLYRGVWYAIGGPNLNRQRSGSSSFYRLRTGIFAKGENFNNDLSNGTSVNDISGAVDESFISNSDRNIPRGMRLAVRKDYDETLQIDSLEFAYSRNGVNHLVDSAGTSADTVSLQVSKSGTSESWTGTQWNPEPAKEQVIGGKNDVGRLIFRTLGGVAQGENYLGIVFKDETDMPTVYEKVIARVS